MQPMSAAGAGRRARRAPLFGVPGRFIVHDVAAGGRWLAVREDLALGVRAMPCRARSGRARSVVARVVGRARALARRRVAADGRRRPAQRARLRRGAAQDRRLAADSARRRQPVSTLARRQMGGRVSSTSPPRLVLYPTGAGEPIQLNAAPIERLTSVDWFPDGRRLLVCGSEAARAPRCYAQDLAGSPPKPLTPECRDATLAPDGRTLLLTLQDGSWQLSSIDGGAPSRVRALRPGDRPSPGAATASRCTCSAAAKCRRSSIASA